MARQNNIPKGPHLRSPLAAPAPRDPSGYPQPYDQPELGEHSPMQPGGPTRDIFNALRPESSLTSRLEPLSASRGHEQDGYGRPPYGDPAGQPYPSQQGGGYGQGGQGGQGYDQYGRPLPGGGYHDGAAGHDPRYYTDPASDPMQRYQQGQGYAPHYGRDDAYAYDDPYRPEGADPYAASPELQGQGVEGEYYGDEFAEEPEARRGPRAVIVVGALIGAIVLGGGLAYGYKSLTNGGRDSGKLPILRADSAPTKAQPTEPGGKQVAHTDKKFVNRLTDDRGAPRSGPGPVPVSILPPTPEREPEGGPRRVPTMVVGRDGSISPTGSMSEPAPPPRVSGVPGMVVEGLTPRAPPAPLREAPRPAPQRSIAVEEAAAPTPPPRRVAAATATVATEPPPAAAPRVDTEAKRRLPSTRQAARTEAPAATPAPASTGAGYVAVLSSRQSHMDALKSFADIQQKYASVLQGRTPDVRQANLGEKGVWYRVVVGPPGSRDSANSVCGQLKAQGYSGCWIMPY